MIKAVPVSLTEARAYIDENHRHHIAAKVDKYRVGAEEDGELVGVAQCGRPVSRILDDGMTIEVLRVQLLIFEVCQNCEGTRIYEDNHIHSRIRKRSVVKSEWVAL